MAFWTAIVSIVAIGSFTGIITKLADCNHKLKQKKLTEASRTNNLAIICQLLNNRPDIALEDLSQYIELEDNKVKQNNETK